MRLAPELHEDLLRLYKLQNLNQNKQRHEWADMLGVLDEFGAGLIRRVLGGTKALGAALDNPLAHFRKHLVQAVKTEVAAKREQRKAQEAREADEAAVRERQERGPLKVEDMDLTPRGRKFLEDLEKRRTGAGVEAESTPTSRGLR